MSCDRRLKKRTNHMTWYSHMTNNSAVTWSISRVLTVITRYITEFIKNLLKNPNRCERIVWLYTLANLVASLAVKHLGNGAVIVTKDWLKHSEHCHLLSIPPFGNQTRLLRNHNLFLSLDSIS